MNKRVRLLICGMALIAVMACSGINDGYSDKNEVPSMWSSSEKAKSTVVRGHQNSDGSIPIGPVNGKYKSVYAFDGDGNWYWDLGDGRVQGSVSTREALDAETVSVCDYEVMYRGDFKGDPFLDNGWIRNNIRCTGYAYPKAQTYNYLIVHETDHRYSTDLTPIWGTWAYFVYALGGTGNIANPHHPVNN